MTVVGWASAVVTVEVGCSCSVVTVAIRLCAVMVIYMSASQTIEYRAISRTMTQLGVTAHKRVALLTSMSRDSQACHATFALGSRDSLEYLLPDCGIGIPANKQYPRRSFSVRQYLSPFGEPDVVHSELITENHVIAPT